MPLGLMWWRRCVSPDDESADKVGAVRFWCERCMPRFEGDFFVLLNGHFKAPCIKVLLLATLEQIAQVSKGTLYFLCLTISSVILIVVSILHVGPLFSPASPR